MCLLDTGCQLLLVRKKIANQLGLKGHPEHSEVSPERRAAEIDVLIGMDFHHKFATNETIKSGENGPHAIESSLGVLMFSEIETENDDETLQKFWKLDSMGIQEPSNEVHGSNLFLKDSIHYDGSRYVVELPWINNMKMLPDNFELANGKDDVEKPGCRIAKYKGIPSMSTWTQVQLCKATWWVYCFAFDFIR
ncbi:hypothetical protein T4D_948 [Trichinella pseudospiralis]|uniref:Peptidase aspartic putative domain-containing protein n=1 Tax=Trichinella pseudospiralis TaxID=6337 RepID=A0A0V1F2G6_TRIPS|nr:hypothetical protein T4D_948 [Trichinella pseudospiralis]